MADLQNWSKNTFVIHILQLIACGVVYVGVCNQYGLSLWASWFVNVSVIGIAAFNAIKNVTWRI